MTKEEFIRGIRIIQAILPFQRCCKNYMNDVAKFDPELSSLLKQEDELKEKILKHLDSKKEKR